MAKSTKELKVKREIKRLDRIFADIDENKKDFVAPKIRDLAWYSVSIEELKRQIDAVGSVITYDNGGGQTGQKVNPDIQTINSYVKLSNDITKLLIELVPAKAQMSKLQQILNDE